MAMSTDISLGNDPAAIQTQVGALERDPNATLAFKQQLQNWLQQVEAAVGESPPGKETSPMQQPVQQPALASETAGPVQAPPLAAPDSKLNLAHDTDGGPAAQHASQPSGTPAAETKSTGVVNVSGADKTITMSNTSDKDMVLYHTGGDGEATQAVATLKPRESVDVTVGNNTNGAFTKGNANGDFTSDSGRVEYSVKDGKMSANLDSECGVDAMSLQAGQYAKKVEDAASGAPASLKDSSGRLLEPKSHPEVQAYLDSLDGYNQNSYTHSDTDTKTHVMEAAMLDVDKISASFS
jgi:hypothetical protein